MPEKVTLVVLKCACCGADAEPLDLTNGDGLCGVCLAAATVPVYA